jgi:GNAT superfamily N-acetyltransferase
MGTVELRTATSADVLAITALVQSAYGHYVERIGGRPRPLDDDYAQVVIDREVLVAEAGGELAGVIVLGTDDEGFHVDNVAVAPAWQGKGVGRVLLVRAEECARDAGHDSIWLLTHELMHENLALYERIGYVEYRRHDYGGGRLVYLRKRLAA